jgi:hypothetical protein
LEIGAGRLIFLICLQLGWIGAPEAKSEQRPIVNIQSGWFEVSASVQSRTQPHFLVFGMRLPLVKEVEGRALRLNRRGRDEFVCRWWAGWNTLFNITSQGTLLGVEQFLVRSGARKVL